MKWIKKVAATPLTNIAKVIDSLEQSVNERFNAPSIRAVREAIQGSSLALYPVGSIYMSVNAVNPSTIFGGTWQQIKDRFILACGDNYANGATGGSATNTLTVSNLPSHSHSYTAPSSVGGHTLTESEIPAHDHGVSISGQALGAIVSMQPALVGTTSGNTEAYRGINQGNLDVTGMGTTSNTGGGGSHTHPLNTSSATTGTSGSGAAVNNMPPYLAVNVWVRTA